MNPLITRNIARSYKKTCKKQEPCGFLLRSRAVFCAAKPLHSRAVAAVFDVAVCQFCGVFDARSVAGGFIE